MTFSSFIEDFVILLLNTRIYKFYIRK